MLLWKSEEKEGSKKVEKITKLLIQKIADEWTLAGHALSGSFIESLESYVQENDKEIVIDIWGNEYGIYMSEGVTPDRIPYTSRKGTRGKRGGTSKYITGLQNYVKMRLGISDEREALGIAFAIAEKHKENGIIGSGFLEEVTKKHNDAIQQEISNYLDETIKKLL